MIKDMLASLGMFTKIKVRDSVFRDSRGPSVLCWFAFDGAVCGAVSCAVYLLLRFFSVDRTLSGALLTLSLFLVSGFLHLDGFMDCADSLLSSRDREGKIRILKDPNVGAFAVISVCLLLILLFSSMCVIREKDLPWQMFMLLPFASRAFESIVLFTFRPLENNKGLLYYFGNGKRPVHIVTVGLETLAAFAAAWFVSPVLTAVLAAGAVVTLVFSKTAEHLLGGINGDVIGAGVIIFETAAYLAAALAM